MSNYFTRLEQNDDAHTQNQRTRDKSEIDYQALAADAFIYPHIPLPLIGHGKCLSPNLSITYKIEPFVLIAGIWNHDSEKKKIGKNKPWTRRDKIIKCTLLFVRDTGLPFVHLAHNCFLAHAATSHATIEVRSGSQRRTSTLTLQYWP